MATTINATVTSSPAKFKYVANTGLYNVTFNIPPGTWQYATWTRIYSIDQNEAPANGVTTGTTHKVLWPQLSGPSSGSDSVSANAAQIADINAAAGGSITVGYGRTNSDSDLSTNTISSFTLVLVGTGGNVLRSERATVYEGAQFGVETTPGTRVAGNKRLLGLEIDFDNMTDIKAYRPQGNKFMTTSQIGKEWTDGKINGIQCYNDMVYLASSWMSLVTPTVPTNNSKWNVSGASGTWGFTFKGSTLAPATYANAAAAQAAIGAMTSVGVGNVKVTGAAPAFTIQWIGALSTDTSAITSPTGTPTPTITLDTAGTLTNRWKFIINPFGPDNIQTFTIEKGANGIANLASVASFGFVHGLSFKYNKNEASLTGGFAAQTATEPFTLTASPTDIACVPVNMKDVSVYAGTSLNNLVLLDRIFDLEFGAQNRASGLITLNQNDPSFSNRIETAPDLTFKFAQEHDAAGQAMLANLRANVPLFFIVESIGNNIETGFPYRMKWTCKVKNTKPSPGDVDGAYVKNYDGHLEYDSTLGSALQLEIDSPLSTL